MKKFLLTWMMLFAFSLSAFALSDELTTAFFGKPSAYSKNEATSTTTGVKYIGVITSSGDDIQLNSKTITVNGTSYRHGVYSTESNYAISSIEVKYASGTNQLNVYGSEEPFTNANATTNAVSMGTLKASGTIEFKTDKEYKYFSVFSNSGAIYISKIVVNYKDADDERTSVSLSFGGESKYTVNIGESFSMPQLTVEPAEATSAVVISSEKESIAKYVDGNLQIVGVGTTKISATIPSDNEQYKSNTASFELTVVDPNAIETTLNSTFFNYIKNVYNSVNKGEDEATGYTYHAIYSGTTTEMSFNAGNKNGGKSSQIVVTGAGDGYIIESITIESSTDANVSKFKIYKSDTPYAVPTVDTNNTPTASGTEVTATSAGTYEINAKAFLMLPIGTSSITITGVKVKYAKVNSDSEASGLSFDETSFKIGEGDEFTAPTLNNPKNIEVVYSSSVEEVAMVDDKTGEVVLMGGFGTTTITATPVDTEKYTGSASYTLTVSTIYDSIEKLLELGNGETATVECPLTVVAIQGSYCYVIDNMGGHGLIYKKELSYTPGDVIPAGWEVKMSIYNGLPELVPTGSVPAAIGKAEVEIEVCDAADLAALMVNEVVYVNGVTFTAATPTSGSFTGVSDGVSINFYNSAQIASVAAGVYDVLLAASVYNTTVQYIPLAYTPTGAEPVVKEDIEEFKWSEADVTVIDGEEYVLPVFSCSDPDVEVVFASSNPEVADVEDGVIVLNGDFGTATITATLSNHEVYNDAVATCNVTVKRAGIKTPQHTGTWRLVTDVNDLKDGEIYTLVGYNTAETAFVMSNTADTYISANEVTISDNKFDSSESTAFIVLQKSGDGYSFYLTNGKKGNDDNQGYISCDGYSSGTLLASGSSNKNNKHNIKITEELQGNASIATVKIDTVTGAATVNFKESLTTPNEAKRLTFAFNKTSGTERFSCYTADGQNPVYFYGVHTPAPQVKVVNENDDEYEVELFTEMDGAEIWYRVMPVKSAAKIQSREAAEEDEVPYELAPSNNHHVVLSTDKRVDYYSVLYGRQSDSMSHSKVGGTTGIYEVKNVIEQMPAMWFDLQGRRVNAPAKGGVYILKQGVNVSKVRL